MEVLILFRPIPDYYKIPAAVFHSLKLSPGAKLLYGIIYRYAQNGKADGFCFAGDKLLSELMHTSIKTIRRHLYKELETQEHIYIEEEPDKQRKIYPLTKMSKIVPLPS
jgi:hypothetical protein